jgi:hypothetical protein
MPASQRNHAQLIVLIILGCLALNYPLLALFNKPVKWFGIPLLYLYIFVFWALFIALLAIGLEREKPTKPLSKTPKFRG